MKRLLIILFLVCILLIPSTSKSAFIMRGSGGVACYTCPGDSSASFIWELNSTTVGSGTPPDCGCVTSGGDSTATATDPAPSISSGIATFGSNENYYFDVSSNDIIDDTVGTVFIKFMVTTWGNLSTLFKVDHSASDQIAIYFDYDDGIVGQYTGNGTAVGMYGITSGLSNDTWYVVRYRWRTGSTDPSQDIYVFVSDCSSTVANTSTNTDLTSMSTALDANDLKVGNRKVVSTSIDMDYIHVFKEWRDTDPYGDCIMVP